MQKFEEFYDIKIGMPEARNPSFCFRVTDCYGRIGNMMYGTIKPCDAASVDGYNPNVLGKLLKAYLHSVLPDADIRCSIECTVFLDTGLRYEPLRRFLWGKLHNLNVAPGMLLSRNDAGSLFMNHIYGFQPDILCQLYEAIMDMEKRINRNTRWRENFLAEFMDEWGSYVVDYKAPESFHDRVVDKTNRLVLINNLRPTRFVKTAGGVTCVIEELSIFVGAERMHILDCEKGTEVEYTNVDLAEDALSVAFSCKKPEYTGIYDWQERALHKAFSAFVQPYQTRFEIEREHDDVLGTVKAYVLTDRLNDKVYSLGFDEDRGFVYWHEKDVRHGEKRQWNEYDLADISVQNFLEKCAEHLDGPK